MNQIKKKAIGKISTTHDVTVKMTPLFVKTGHGVTIVTSLTQNQFFQKIFMNTNPHAKFGVLTFSSLGVK